VNVAGDAKTVPSGFDGVTVDGFLLIDEAMRIPVRRGVSAVLRPIPLGSSGDDGRLAQAGSSSRFPCGGSSRVDGDRMSPMASMQRDGPPASRVCVVRRATLAISLWTANARLRDGVTICDLAVPCPRGRLPAGGRLPENGDSMPMRPLAATRSYQCLLWRKNNAIAQSLIQRS